MVVRIALQKDGKTAGVRIPSRVTEYDVDPEGYDVRCAGVPGDVEFYLDLARQSTPPLLELGCGTGRVTIPIARAGIPIVGLDAAPAMLDLARRKSDQRDAVRWVQGDMRDFQFAERFGLVIIPYRSLLHLVTVEDRQSALECIQRHLAPGGALAFDIYNPSVAAAIAQAHGVRPARGSSPPRRLRSRTYPGLALSYLFRDEVECLLGGAGYQITSLFGSFDREPFRDQSSEMIWVASRS